jgi:enoyl-CoA hydratase/carnithine racemase
MILELSKAPANSLDLRYLKELYGILCRVERNSNITGVLLKSSFKTCFSSGLDLRKLAALSPGRQKRNILRAVWFVYKIVKRIIKSKKIYTASVSGAVVGSAVSIIMACDFRFGQPDTWFWLPDPMYGGLLADGGISLMKKSLGIPRAKLLCLTNKRINALEALHFGILHEIKKVSDAESYTTCFSKQLASYSYNTLQLTKALLNKNLLEPFPLFKLLKAVHSKDMANRIKKYI